jgi:hypothetical protein
MLVTLLIIACPPTRGCLESSFTLSQESRLPKWFASAGVPRDEATVTMDYYIGGLSRTAVFILRNGKGRRIAGVVGEQQGHTPLFVEGRSGADFYPSYEIITVDDITEVIEHRRMEPIFYITDDLVVKQKLGVR